VMTGTYQASSAAVACCKNWAGGSLGVYMSDHCRSLMRCDASRREQASIFQRESSAQPGCWQCSISILLQAGVCSAHAPAIQLGYNINQDCGCVELRLS